MYLRLSVLLSLIASSEESVLIWHTNRVNSGQFDCLHYSNDTEHAESVPFCRRPSFIEPDDSPSPYKTCQNNGSYHTFTELAINEIQPEQLIIWNSGIDVLDTYATFLDYVSRWGSAGMINESHQLHRVGICNCSGTSSTYFGRWCEYQLLSSVNFQTAVDHQYALKEEFQIGSQLFGNVTCYISFPECDSGPVCLDWRHICDGRFL